MVNGEELELFFGIKGKELCSRFISIQTRLPQFFPKGLLKELPLFLAHASPSFLEARPLSLLSRIFISHQKFIKKQNKKVSFKLLKINPSVLGISLAVFSLGQQEMVNNTHILKSIQKFLPAIKIVQDSYFAIQKGTTHLFYIEIKKMRGGIFLEEEEQKLKENLQEEVKHGIESLSPTLFFPGNEEELFKNIRQLSNEIKSGEDLPQVMISFIEYVQGKLKFLVIALRLTKSKASSISSLSTRLPPFVRFTLDNIVCVDTVQKKYPKEASVFTLEIDGALFQRNNNAINLRAARQYIVKALENMLGPFRDYNGGFLNKEHEQFLLIKRSLEGKGLFVPFLEDFFYGIKPINLRVLILVQTGVELIALFLKIASSELKKKEKYLLELAELPDCHLAVIKTKEIEYKEALPNTILAYSPEIGFTMLEQDGYFYLFFFHQYPYTPHLIRALKKELKRETFLLEPKSKKGILHLNFQGGDPPTLNPRLAADVHSHILSNFLFEGLTSIDRSGKVEMAAAEKVEISPCRLRYTFFLKSSFWSNGEELTAFDFERSWKKALGNPSGCVGAGFFTFIKNAQKVREKSLSIEEVGIKAKDAKTLAIELETPCPYFLNLLATPSFFPLFGTAEEPSFFNGPFTLSQHKADDSIFLSQNPFFRDADKVKLGGIKISMVRDFLEAYKMFEKGELDMIGDPITPLPPEILQNKALQKQFHYKPISRIFWIHCNTYRFPLNNANVRRALSYAINRERLTENVFIHQIPHISPLPPKYSSVSGCTRGDRNRAKEYFNIALKELKLDHSQFPQLTITHSDLSFEEPLIRELKLQWEEVLGISICTEPLQWYEFSSALQVGNFQLGGLFRRDLFNNPMFFLSFFKNAPFNPHKWDNNEYAELLGKLYREENVADNMKKMEKLLIEESPVIPLVSQRYLALVNKRLEGFEWNENGCLDLKEVWINER